MDIWDLDDPQYYLNQARRGVPVDEIKSEIKNRHGLENYDLFNITNDLDEIYMRWLKSREKDYLRYAQEGLPINHLLKIMEEDHVEPSKQFINSLRNISTKAIIKLKKEEKERAKREEIRREQEMKEYKRQLNKSQVRQHKYNYYTKMIREGYNTPQVRWAVMREPTFDPNENQYLLNRVTANSRKVQNIRTRRAYNKAVNEAAKESVNETARNFFTAKEAEVNEMARQKEEAARLEEEAARLEEEQKRKNKTFLGRIKKALTLKKKGGKRKTLRNHRNTTQRR